MSPADHLRILNTGTGMSTPADRIAKGAAIKPERQIRARRRQMALSSIMVPLPSPNSRRVAVCELDPRFRKGSLDLG